MKQLILNLLLLSLFLGCEWRPDPVSIADETSFRAVNLALNDTTEIKFLGSNLQVTGYADENIAQVESLTDSVLTLIGVSEGETSLILSYLSSDERETIAHLRVLVSDGIILGLHYGEPRKIHLSEYLSPAQLEKVDSMHATLAQAGADLEVTVNPDSVTVDLLSYVDGEATLEILTFDSLDVLVAPLIFKTSTTIRSVVLAEIFTNAGCVNCPTANENLDHLYLEYPENFSAIRYHVFWTDPRDPMNLYNPSEVEDRRVYYGSSFEAPRLFMDGALENDFDKYQTLSNSVGQSITAGARTYIEYTGLNASTDSLFLEFRIKNFDPVYDAARVWTVLTEDSIEYVGTNGETIHNQAMRDMISTELTTFSAEITLTHSLKRTPDFVMDEKYHLVTFIQHGGSKEILQTIDVAVTEIQ